MALTNKGLEDEWAALNGGGNTRDTTSAGSGGITSAGRYGGGSSYAARQQQKAPTSAGSSAGRPSARALVITNTASDPADAPLGPTTASTSAASAFGKLLKVPSTEYPTIEDAIIAARDGDCVYLEPLVYAFTETLMVEKSIHIIGVDEVGACATIRMDGGLLRPPLPALRLCGAKVHLKGLKIDYRHDTERAAIEAVSNAFSVVVSEGGTLVLDEVHIVSTCGGIKGNPSSITVAGGKDVVAPPTYVTAVCCRFECDTMAVRCEGRCFLDRCTVAVGARGVAVLDAANAKVEGSSFTGGGIGIDVQRRGRAHIERNAFVSVAIGVNIYHNGVTIPQPTVVRGNEFRHPTEAAIKTDGEGATGDITKNLIHGFQHDGAVGVLVCQGKPEITSNVVKDALGTAIGLYGGSPLVESNVLEGGRVGIVIRSSRPTIRLNEICQQSEVGVLVESSTIPRSGVPGVPSNALLGLGDRDTALVAASGPSAVVHPLNEADPLIEGNSIHDCHTNLKVCSCTCTFLKNELLMAQSDSVVLDGPVVVPIVVSGNMIGGSREGCCVLATAGVEAHITDNDMVEAKVACVMLRGSGFCEVKGNLLADSQTAFVAMQRSVGKVFENDIGEGMGVDVYTDSQPTVTVIQ